MFSIPRVVVMWQCWVSKPHWPQCAAQWLSICNVFLTTTTAVMDADCLLALTGGLIGKLTSTQAPSTNHWLPATLLSPEHYIGSGTLQDFTQLHGKDMHQKVQHQQATLSLVFPCPCVKNQEMQDKTLTSGHSNGLQQHRNGRQPCVPCSESEEKATEKVANWADETKAGQGWTKLSASLGYVGVPWTCDTLQSSHFDEQVRFTLCVFQCKYLNQTDSNTTPPPRQRFIAKMNILRSTGQGCMHCGFQCYFLLEGALDRLRRWREEFLSINDKAVQDLELLWILRKAQQQPQVPSSIPAVVGSASTDTEKSEHQAAPTARVGGGRGGGSTDTEESNRSNDEVDLQAGSITGTDQSDNEATRARTNKRGKKFLVLVEPYMLVYFGIVCYVW